MPNKLLIPHMRFSANHPFKIDVKRSGPLSNRKIDLAVNYHSKIYKSTSTRGQYLEFDILPITGLDFTKQQAVSKIQAKNFYCVLVVTISDLQAQSAKINWVEGDSDKDSLAPIKFSDADSYKQVEARVIIGVIVYDLESDPALKNDTAKIIYPIQYVTSNLIMANMVFNGIPVIYPVPIGGGRLNPGQT